MAKAYRFKMYFLLLVGTAFYIAACKEESKSKTSALLPAKFVTPFNNTSIQKGKELNIEVDIPAFNEIQNLKVAFRDSVLFNGEPSNSNLQFKFSTASFKVGSAQVSLEVEMKDGKKRKDQRLIKILSNVLPQDFVAEVVNVFPHNTASYTQGLEFYQGRLFESTGGMGKTGGKSYIAEVNYQTGEILRKHILDDQYFGEGITILNGKIYQLTWQQNKCFVYDVNTFELINTFDYAGEGWGMTNDGTYLIMSDGSERLYYRDPSTFQIVKTIEVYNHIGPQRMLNELEYIQGKILANVYLTNNIVKINPNTGIVDGIIDAAIVALEYKKDGEVLNGIAYEPQSKRLFITGKNWPNLLEIELNPL
ncbi:MAG: glutaminyl-peptide cyclotransferase [Crocinitomicaceae bacterium]|nr:glutaminyl-peptide cyclotransferase [Crocinitomicaceae bacterium]